MFIYRKTISSKNITGPKSRVYSFAPGLFLIALGLVVFLAPELILALIATFFVFVGALVCFFTWKFFQLKRRFDQAREELEKQFKNSSFGEARTSHTARSGTRRYEDYIVDIELHEDGPSGPGKKQKTYILH